MNRIHVHEDLNGVDGGILSLHEENGNYLLLMESEVGSEYASVWVTREELTEFVNKMDVEELEE